MFHVNLQGCNELLDVYREWCDFEMTSWRQVEEDLFDCLMEMPHIGGQDLREWFKVMFAPVYR